MFGSCSIFCGGFMRRLSLSLVFIVLCFFVFFIAGDLSLALEPKIQRNGGATWREVQDKDDGNGILTDEAFSAHTLGTNEKKLAAFTGPKHTRFSYELDSLPAQDGQFWVVYDISPYTEHLSHLDEPQTPIVNWILFDSGKDFWSKEPFCILSASRERLYVYHNSNVQQYVSNVVDRFVDPTKKNYFFSIKVLAIKSPEWRVRFASLLSPTNVLLKGNGSDIQGWLVEREDITRIVSEIQRRSDYRQLSDEKDSVPNGETYGWGWALPKRTFSRDYRLDPKSSTGYVADITAVDEGVKIETTPLLSTTGETLELYFHYSSTVVEKMKTFSMRIPTPSAPKQQLNVERPEILSCDFSGKIAIPRSKAAIIDLGMVPLPQKTNDSSEGLANNVSNFIFSKTIFYDVLIIIDCLE